MLDATFSKDRILEAYVNEVFLGQWGNRAIHGFGTTAQFYFGRPISELSIAQWALLIGLVKGPSAFNPRRSPERALERRNLVLSLSSSQGVIAKTTAEAADRSPAIDSDRLADRIGRFPGYVSVVRRELTNDYKLKQLTAGLKIYTAFDPQVQRGLTEGGKIYWPASRTSAWIRPVKYRQRALVVDIPTGEIQAVLASRDDREVSIVYLTRGGKSDLS